MIVKFKYDADTKNCVRFISGDKGGTDTMSFYLKRSIIDAEGIDKNKGITVTVEQTKDETEGAE